VIQLDDSRPAQPPSFEALKPRLLQQAQAQLITKLLDSLRAQAKID
jgi:peptidyl-prolyl cis-trans isomerase C